MSWEKYEALGAKMADPAIGPRVAEDEARFFGRNSMMMFLVDERGTSPEDRTAGAKRAPA
ncbi:hypothetical protein [Sphingomonas sp.]|uniref:hypothetical protein n=1 Tax=Sphingomonas sp. TaxID=28214 RepID=UPI003AFFB685